MQVTLAVRYMHSCQVLHRDLKTENVFLNKSATLCKIGMSVLAKVSRDSLLISVYWSVKFLSCISVLTLDIDMAILSVCLSVCLSITFCYQMKTA